MPQLLAATVSVLHVSTTNIMFLNNFVKFVLCEIHVCLEHSWKLMSGVITGFSHMTRQLQSLAGGRVVLVLEGGYELTSMSDAAEACLRTLLGYEVSPTLRFVNIALFLQMFS